MVHDNVLEAIGQTPLVKLNKVVGPDDATVLAKLEYLNPGGAIKDRMALYIIEQAERAGLLRPGSIIVENTSGNTGVGVAMAAAVKGYRCVFTMPDKMSKEKQDTLKAFGAKVVVTPTNVPADSPESYYSVAKRIAEETPNAFYLNQYHNPDNIRAHYELTGPEIWEQTGGRLDAFVAGIGTGGTISGCGKFFKEKNPAIRVIGVDPIGSVYYDLFKTGRLIQPHVYKVEGIGEDMMCAATDFSVIDDVRRVDDRQSFIMARRLAREEGIFAGGSSGSAVHVAARVARELGKGKVIVVPLPDSGRAYISKFYSDEWMRDNGFLEPDSFDTWTAADVLQARGGRVVVVRSGVLLKEAVALLRRHDVSQVPVVDGEGHALGMLHESDVLAAMLADSSALDKPVASAMSVLDGRVTPSSTLSEVREVFEQDKVAVVMDGRVPVGIITKIDVIDFLGSRTG